MLVAAAVCPHPPLIVPELASGAAAELAPLRDACRAAVSALADARPDALVVVGRDEGGTRSHAAGATGTFRGYGPAVDVHLGDGAPDPEAPRLPLSLSVAARLLADHGWAGPVRGLGVAPGEDPEVCAGLGRDIADAPGRTALLVMGDASASRTEKAPGYLDARAEPYDAEIARALTEGDAAFLAALDPALAEELLVAGRAAWQVMAGAMPGVADARLLYDEAPYGVGYLTAVWLP